MRKFSFLIKREKKKSKNIRLRVTFWGRRRRCERQDRMEGWKDIIIKSCNDHFLDEGEIFQRLQGVNKAGGDGDDDDGDDDDDDGSDDSGCDDQNCLPLM